MIVKLIGISELDFVATNGEHIKGNNLYVCYPADNVMGNKCDRFFVNQNIQLPDVKIGSNIDVAFNNKGKVEAVTLK